MGGAQPLKLRNRDRIDVEGVDPLGEIGVSLDAMESGLDV